jgi:hypothetical protein
MEQGTHIYIPFLLYNSKKFLFPFAVSEHCGGCRDLASGNLQIEQHMMNFNMLSFIVWKRMNRRKIAI